MTEKAPVSIQLELAGFSIEVLPDCIFHSAVNSTSHVLHEHAVHELYYIEEGEMLFACGDTPYTLLAGDLFMIAAGEPHRVVSYSDTMRWFHLRFQLLPSHPGCTVSTCFLPAYRRELMQALIREIRTPQGDGDSPMARYRFRSYLGILLSHVLEDLTPTARLSVPVSASSRKNRILRYSQIDSFLYDNCAGVVRLEDLARHLNYSKVQTARLVQECCGMSFSDKLREIRIRLAKQLLTSGELSVSEVAERCGYQTRQGFEAAFMHVVGVSPSVFRKKENTRS